MRQLKAKRPSDTLIMAALKDISDAELIEDAAMEGPEDDFEVT